MSACSSSVQNVTGSMSTYSGVLGYVGGPRRFLSMGSRFVSICIRYHIRSAAFACGRR